MRGSKVKRTRRLISVMRAAYPARKFPSERVMRRQVTQGMKDQRRK